MVVNELHIPTLVLVDDHSASTITIDGCSAQAILTKPLQLDTLLQTVKQLIATTA